MTDILKRNNVTVTGNGTKVLFFAHGFGCDQQAWKYIRSSFEADYKLVFIDYVGAGKSDLNAYDAEKYASLDGYATDIIEICDALNLTGAIFIGHSVGCMIGSLASIQRPELFEKLIFIGPSPCYLNRGLYQGGFERETLDDLFDVMNEDYIVWARSITPSIMNADNGEELNTELTESFCSIDPEIARQFARVTFLSDNRKDIELIPVQSLTIQCTDDIIAPQSVGEFINKHTPHNRLVKLNAKGHCPHMSHPDEIVRIIRSYLS